MTWKYQVELQLSGNGIKLQRRMAIVQNDLKLQDK